MFYQICQIRQCLPQSYYLKYSSIFSILTQKLTLTYLSPFLPKAVPGVNSICFSSKSLTQKSSVFLASEGILAQIYNPPLGKDGVKPNSFNFPAMISLRLL